MAVYFIVEIKTKNNNKDSYAKYIEKVRPIVEKYKGRYFPEVGKLFQFLVTGNQKESL